MATPKKASVTTPRPRLARAQPKRAQQPRAPRLTPPPAPAGALDSALKFEHDACFANLRFVADTWRDFEPVVQELALTFPVGGWGRIEEAAMEWVYVARSRRRWLATGESQDEHNARAAALLASWGVSPGKLQSLARAHLVEVAMLASDSDDGGWSLRVLPWEHLISAATSPYRHGDPITVIRSMQVDRSRPRPARAVAKPPARGRLRVLYVESAPGEAGTLRSFKGQRELVATYLVGSAAGAGVTVLYSPSVAELTEAIANVKPHIVHLTGFDAHESRLRTTVNRMASDDPSSLAPAPIPAPQELRDGFVLAQEDGQPAIVNVESLAVALTGRGRWFPWMVCFNVENSSARMAARAVQFGVHAAVAIQDTLDAALASRFYGTLYAGLRRKLALSEAFQRAWLSIRSRPGQLTGSGVVLWTAGLEVTPQKAARSRPSAWAPTATLVPEDRADAAALAARIMTEIVPSREINYAQLHNDGALFEAFAIQPHPDHLFESVEVKVTLCAGSEDAQYQTVLDLTGQPVDLRNEVHVALSAALLRGLHEAISTTVIVDIRWGRHVIHRNTYPVRLLPSDQWRDALHGRSWLPSFIFPRDAATTAIVGLATAYLRVLQDDPQAGFTGYGAQHEMPGSPANCRGVDTQVNALWSAIVHEWSPAYITPPPSYSLELDSQRLRTPSMVAHERQGTCIDLALMFAAALELIDVRPVIFLLHNHALVGYWRSHHYHEQFRKAERTPDTLKAFMTTDVHVNSVAGSQRFPWAVGSAMFREVQMEVLLGRLVPVETVSLTRREGFATACDIGKQRLGNGEVFEFLIDVAIARRSNVTPLPLA